MTKWLILLAGILSNASASVLIKYAMLPPRAFPSAGNISAALSNWPLWLGIGFYGMAFILYAAALARLPLNIAHPILTCGAVTAVAISSAIFFHEQFYWTTILGLVFVMVGVALISSRIV